MIKELDAICEKCTQETAMYCDTCCCFTCTHYSLEPEPGEHRCNWCENLLETEHPGTRYDLYNPVYMDGELTWHRTPCECEVCSLNVSDVFPESEM